MDFSAAAAAAAAIAATEAGQNYHHNSVDKHNNNNMTGLQPSYPGGGMNHHQHQQQHQNDHRRGSSSNSLGSYSLNGGGDDSVDGGGLDSMNSSWNGDAMPIVDFDVHQQHHGDNSSNVIYGSVVSDVLQHSYPNEGQQNGQPYSAGPPFEQIHQEQHQFSQIQHYQQPQQLEMELQQQQLQQYNMKLLQQQHQQDMQQFQQYQPLHSSSSATPTTHPSMGFTGHYSQDLERERIESNMQAVASMGYQQQQQPQQYMKQQQVPLTTNPGSVSQDLMRERVISNMAGSRIKTDPESGQNLVREQIGSNMEVVSSMEYQQQKMEQPQNQQLQQNVKRKSPSMYEVIDLLDDDDEGNGSNASEPAAIAGMKRPYPSDSHVQRKPTPIVPGSTIPGFEQQYQPRTESYRTYQQQHHPHQYPPHASNPPPHGQAAAMEQLYLSRNQNSYPQHHQQYQARRSPPPTRTRVNKVHDAKYLDFPPDHTPTWTKLVPDIKLHSNFNSDERRSYEFSLLNVKEFTITGLPVGIYGGPRSSVLGFRKLIKESSRGHGKPTFERDKEFREEAGTDGGKWRIPLGAYPAIFNQFRRIANCSVVGINEEQLRVASLGKARLEKGYPSVKKIIAMGVPKGLAHALAPFQRGGVDFVKEKDGRALIADDMGLGCKTIQGIASMSMYHDEWPLLVLTPSSARYHWEAEFQQWLGKASAKKSAQARVDQVQGETEEEDSEENIPLEEHKNPMNVLNDWEIHVLTSGKEDVFPHRHTKVVVCSYGLAPTLVENGKIQPGMFKCAIVDESHMLKNMKTKRTQNLVPVLHATSRCVLLSGTPALSRPSELWPQLKILSTEKDGMWEDETDFFQKYVQKTSAVRRAELHTMLTGTLMIRRMKHDILKSLPSKQRAKAVVDVATAPMRREFHKCMELLREGKGVMAKLAQKRSALKAPEIRIDEETLDSLKQERDKRLDHRLQNIFSSLQSSSFNDAEKENRFAEMQAQVKQEVEVWYKERIHELQNGLQDFQDEEIDRKSVLNRMYSLTAKAKVPLIAENIKRWLNDPTKGKLCVFAHHIFVLDELENLAGLSNAKDSEARFIRIDGSTSPKERQAQIKAFQTDPGIRIAVLGITAAGVAVTLTASSTVWFAELFWTPALMIQAEDRCHRIGQNAVVNCLYFVAEGTLDVLLWDLLEKKFRDLGEFVEGKEKMKIVVHKIYKSIQDLQSMFSSFDKADFDALADGIGPEESQEDEEGLIKLEDDLQQDITQLAQEEMVMISQGTEGDDDDAGDSSANGLAFGNLQDQAGPGQTEEDAICIIDDDEDDGTEKKCSEEVTVVDDAKTPTQEALSQPNSPTQEFVFYKPLQSPRLYTQTFEGDSFGVQLFYFHGRIVVSANTKGLPKPAPGDILVAVNGTQLALGHLLVMLLAQMKKALSEGPVELRFVEDEAFTQFFLKHLEEQARSAPPPIVEHENGVIELLDDD